MEMLYGTEETRAQRILLALEDMTKPELVVLCQNLEKTIQNKEDDINRINSHYEHLLSLYYEAEERLALLNQELFLSRAQSQSHYEWSSGLSTGESLNYQNGFIDHSPRAEQEKRYLENEVGTDKKPPMHSKEKRLTSTVRNRQSCDFLSKTMTPVLHRRPSQNVHNRNSNACAKSTSYAPAQANCTDRTQEAVSSSWSEYKTEKCNHDDEQDSTTVEEAVQQYITDEEEEEEVDLGITINDNLNILKIDHGSPPPVQRTRFDVGEEEDYDDDDGDEADVNLILTGRAATPFHGERPLTAETAGSEEADSRPATGERRTPDGAIVNQNTTEDTPLTQTTNDLSQEDMVQKSSSVSWSLNIESSTTPKEPRSRQGRSPGRADKSPQVSRRPDKTQKRKNTNYRSMPSQQGRRDDYNSYNENRNSHNNNIPTPDMYESSALPALTKSVSVTSSVRTMTPSGRSDARSARSMTPAVETENPSVRSVGVGNGESVYTANKPDTAERRRNNSGPGVTRGQSPAPGTPLSSQRCYSLDSLAASRNHLVPTPVPSSPRAAIITDELDQVYQTNKMKVRQNSGAVFGSYDSIHRAVSAEAVRGRYPGLIPHAPATPKRPHTAGVSEATRSRSKSLGHTYPPTNTSNSGGTSSCSSSRGSTAQAKSSKPPSGAGHFDVTRLRHRNRAAMTGKSSPRRTQERSPSPLKVRAITRPTSLSVDKSLNKDYSLNKDVIRSSLPEGVKFKGGVNRLSLDANRRVALKAPQRTMTNISAHDY